MAEWQIVYKQTWNERYHSDMNALVDSQLKGFDVEITENFGGAWLAEGDPDTDMVAENGYTFISDPETAKRIQLYLAEYLGREVSLENFDELAKKYEDELTQKYED